MNPKAQREVLFHTWAAQSRARSFAIDRAEGARFHVPGEGWKIDFESQVYNVNVGHGHPGVLGRLRDALDGVVAVGPNVELGLRTELAQKLCDKTGMARVFLASGGAEAVENAVKIAMQVTGRREVIARRRSYHGATLAALRWGGDPRRDAFVDGGLHIDDSDERVGADGRSGWMRSLDELLEATGPERVAAIVLEGFTGTNGMQMPPPDFWPAVRARCDAHGILLIDDEVFSGFGRTGRWFAHEHWGVRPDLLVAGKGMTSGYAPLSAVAVTARVAAHFDERTLQCGLTHHAHPLGCAAALGTIAALEADALVARADQVGRVLEDRLGRLEQHDCVIGSRGLGLMRMFEVVDAAFATALRETCWDRGLYLPGRGSALFCCPPLVIAEDELHTACDFIEAALQGMTAGQ